LLLIHLNRQLILNIFNDLSNYKSNKKTFVTLGTFDGVHIGHQKVIKKLLKSTNKSNAESALLTFFPHPRIVLQKDLGIKLINTIEERTLLLERFGLENLIIQKFSKKFSKLSALEFVRTILVNKLNIAKLIVGYDHQFGKNREGNFEQLKELGHTYDFKVKEISKKDLNNIAVSSTKIRHALEQGEIKKANSYLGYCFMLSGTIVKGNSLGATIGFPTANLSIKESYKLIPKLGAYVVKSIINSKIVYGMMNIGYRPTIGDLSKTIEVHFFDLDEDLYDQKIQVDLLKFLRTEKKFDSMDQLKMQLEQDKQNSQEFIRGTFFDSSIKE